jgi:hypothetical protein
MSEEEHRLAISCSGKMRFEHMNKNTLIGASLWTNASPFLKGTPVEN